jgi:hypothetical protein
LGLRGADHGQRREGGRQGDALHGFLTGLEAKTLAQRSRKSIVPQQPSLSGRLRKAVCANFRDGINMVLI